MIYWLQEYFNALTTSMILQLFNYALHAASLTPLLLPVPTPSPLTPSHPHPLTPSLFPPLTPHAYLGQAVYHLRPLSTSTTTEVWSQRKTIPTRERMESARLTRARSLPQWPESTTSLRCVHVDRTALTTCSFNFLHIFPPHCVRAFLL